MIRVFHNRACKQMESLYLLDGNYSIAPHNHRQDITLYALRGDVCNLSFKVDRRSHDREHTEFRFGSAIVDGKIEAHYRDCVDLYLDSANIIGFSGLFLSWQEVHTVLSSPGAAWAVVEGEEAPESAISLCYSRKNRLAFDQTDLYQPISSPADYLCGGSLLYEDAMEVLNKAGVSV